MKDLRKVLYKQFNESEYIYSPDGESSVKVDGTGCYDSNFIREGVFHCWGMSYDEFENGASSYTNALIEKPDGEMMEILPQFVKFVDCEDKVLDVHLLGLKSRIRDVFLRAGIFDLNEVKEITRRHFESNRGVGKKTMIEVGEVLEKYNVKFKA